MVLKNKILKFKKDYIASSLRRSTALSQLYKDYIEYLKVETINKIDELVLKQKEKEYHTYQNAYYDIGEEQQIFDVVYNHKYSELKKKLRLKYRVYREATRRKIAKLNPDTEMNEIESLKQSIIDFETQINKELEDTASGWKNEFDLESQKRTAKNPSADELNKLKKEIEDRLSSYRKECEEKQNTKLAEKIAKLEIKIKKYDEKVVKLSEKLTQVSTEHAQVEASETLASNEARVTKLQKEINKYEGLLATADETNKNKYEKILNVLRTDLSLLDHAGRSKEEIIKDDEVLAIDNLCMYFGGIKAVNKLSFTVKHKEIFGLIGPNGAGKTTVFNCITQFYKPTAGNISFRNKNNEIVDLTKEVVHNVILQGIVRTFQNLEVIKDITVLDNLLIAAHRNYTSNLFHHMFHTPILKVEENVITQRALKVLEFMGLLKYKDMYAWGLPYGILKKIEIARTLMCNPQLIILDEPAAGLNDSETVELAELIRRIRDEYNTTILLVEHDMGLVMDVCDRICAISFGNLLALGTPKEIQNNKAVQEAYLGVSED